MSTTTAKTSSSTASTCENAAPSKEFLGIGIWFHTNSMHVSISFRDENGQIEAEAFKANENGSAEWSAMVGLNRATNELLLGDEAEQQIATNPDGFFQIDLLQLLGKTHSELPSLVRKQPWLGQAEEMPLIKAATESTQQQVDVHPEFVLAKLLKLIRHEVQRRLAWASPDALAICVPDDGQVPFRQALLNGARMAGFKQPSLVNESAAAAICIATMENAARSSPYLIIIIPTGPLINNVHGTVFHRHDGGTLVSIGTVQKGTIHKSPGEDFSQARIDVICIGDTAEEQQNRTEEFIKKNSLAPGQCRTNTGTRYNLGIFACGASLSGFVPAKIRQDIRHTFSFAIDTNVPSSKPAESGQFTSDEKCAIKFDAENRAVLASNGMKRGAKIAFFEAKQNYNFLQRYSGSTLNIGEIRLAASTQIPVCIDDNGILKVQCGGREWQPLEKAGLFTQIMVEEEARKAEEEEVAAAAREAERLANLQKQLQRKQQPMWIKMVAGTVVYTVDSLRSIGSAIFSRHQVEEEEAPGCGTCEEDGGGGKEKQQKKSNDGK